MQQIAAAKDSILCGQRHKRSSLARLWHRARRPI